MALKRTKLDKVISNLIREAADWKCERCGMYYPEGHRRGLECSHYYGRRGLSTRWHPDNLSSFCTGCHFHMSGARDEYTAFLKKTLGNSRFDELVLRGNSARKYSPLEREEMYIHYCAQLKYLERRRKSGEEGPLPVVPYD